MDFLSRKQPVTPAEHVALLPEPLRAVIARELAAGNEILEAGGGFPAAPVGLWVKLAKPFLTATQDPPSGAVFALRPVCSWPAEYTDPPRHNFVICVPGEVKTPPPPAPPPDPPRRSRGPALSQLKRKPGSVPPSPAVQRRVNRAIEVHMALWFTEEREAAMLEDAGAEGLALIHEIHAFAEQPEFWVQGENMENYRKVQKRLREQYPFLSEDSVVRMASSAAWGWK